MKLFQIRVWTLAVPFVLASCGLNFGREKIQQKSGVDLRSHFLVDHGAKRYRPFGVLKDRICNDGVANQECSLVLVKDADIKLGDEAYQEFMMSDPEFEAALDQDITDNDGFAFTPSTNGFAIEATWGDITRRFESLATLELKDQTHIRLQDARGSSPSLHLSLVVFDFDKMNFGPRIDSPESLGFRIKIYDASDAKIETRTLDYTLTNYNVPVERDISLGEALPAQASSLSVCYRTADPPGREAFEYDTTTHKTFEVCSKNLSL